MEIHVTPTERPVINLKEGQRPAKAQRVTFPLDQKQAQVIADTMATLRAKRLLALSSSHIGEPYRVVVVETGEQLPIVMINPVVSSLPGSKEAKMDDICPSFPSKILKIKRPLKVRVRFLDTQGSSVVQKFEGILARAIFSSVDFLDGITIFDRLSSLAKRIRNRPRVRI